MRHGTISCYQSGCRCDDCRGAARDAKARQRWKRKTGDVEVDERTAHELAEQLRAYRIARGLIRVAAATPDWYEDAACKGQTALFFPVGTHGGHGGMQLRTGPALAVCAQCPVREPCRTQARRDREFGIWGGESEYDRARLGIVPNAAQGKLHELRRDSVNG